MASLDSSDEYGRVGATGPLADIAKYCTSVVVNKQAFEGVGIIHVNAVVSSRRVGILAHDVLCAFKNFVVDNLEEAKQRAKSKILRAEAERGPEHAAILRTRHILAGVKEGSVFAAIDNVSASQVNAAARRVADNFSIASYGNIENVLRRGDLHDAFKDSDGELRRKS